MASRFLICLAASAASARYIASFDDAVTSTGATATTADPVRRILVVNDFTTNYVKSQPSPITTGGESGFSFSGHCPNNNFPEAAAELDFTTRVIAGLSWSSNESLAFAYYPYYGGDETLPLEDASAVPQADFTQTARASFYTQFCIDGPFASNLTAFVSKLDAVQADALVLFSAASASEIVSSLPLKGARFSSLIILGLDGAGDASAVYPNAFLPLADFNSPDAVIDKIEQLLL